MYLGGSALNLLDCAEDYRRGMPDRPPDQVPGAVPVMYLSQSPFDCYELAEKRVCGWANRTVARCPRT